MELLSKIPRFLVRPVGLRYVAGETRDDALRVTGDLRREGALVTVDVLGEEVTDETGPRAAVEEYLALIDDLADVAPDASISIKPTQLGLRMGRDLARRNMNEVFRHAARRDIEVQIDMEDHTTTDATLALYSEMQVVHGNGGVALQARLRRTARDIEALDPSGRIRLCKGIYPEGGDVAWTGFDEIREAYARDLERLLDRGVYVGIATHDDVLVQWARQLIETRGLGTDAYEFQMLLGVRQGLRGELLAEGHRVRVYVPYGNDWYAYSMRRLRESPDVAKHVVRAWLLGD